MNRRHFLQSLSAAATIPALPALPAAAPVAIPNSARFWAIYMTRLHGDVTPGMLTQMTGIAPASAKAIRAKLIADKVITPIGLMRKGIATALTHNTAEASPNLVQKAIDHVSVDDPAAEADQREEAHLEEDAHPHEIVENPTDVTT